VQGRDEGERAEICADWGDVGTAQRGGGVSARVQVRGGTGDSSGSLMPDLVPACSN
jgi:hypothetical protein